MEHQKGGFMTHGSDAPRGRETSPPRKTVAGGKALWRSGSVVEEERAIGRVKLVEESALDERGRMRAGRARRNGIASPRLDERVGDTEELEQQKSREFCSCGRISTAIKPNIMEELEEINHKIGLPQGPKKVPSDTPRDPIIRSANYRSTISAPHGSLGGLSSSSGRALLGEGSHESGNPVEKINTDFIGVTRQLEVSKLELQTLRKQVVKESRRGHDLDRELQSMKEESDVPERECLELKA
ncbi:hypothetical protein KSP40_PGU011508 [Platanthera guangdongensis]|uniref:Uncharacterized protein n=1 Tax=Platanthera guangdongensis TaxID=2320717 RepID=A0ABR2N670_9ASPA